MSSAILTPEIQKPPYVNLRVRFDGTSSEPVLRIQGEGPEINRPYGVAEVIGLEPGSTLAMWVHNELGRKNNNPFVPSLATGNEQKYFKAEARRDVNDTLRLHLFGAPLNRHYGACVTVSDADAVTIFAKEVEGTVDDPSDGVDGFYSEETE